MQNQWLKSILGEFQGYINEVKQNAQAQGINADFLDLQEGVLNHRAVVGEGEKQQINYDRAVIYLINAVDRDTQNNQEQLTSKQLDAIAKYANQFLQKLTLSNIIEVRAYQSNAWNFDKSKLRTKDGVAVIGMNGSIVTNYILYNISYSFATDELIKQQRDFGGVKPEEDQFYYPGLLTYFERASLAQKGYGNIIAIDYGDILAKIDIFHKINPLIATGFVVVHALGHNAGFEGHSIYDGIMTSAGEIPELLKNRKSIFDLANLAIESNQKYLILVKNHFR